MSTMDIPASSACPSIFFPIIGTLVDEGDVVEDLNKRFPDLTIATFSTLNQAIDATRTHQETHPACGIPAVIITNDVGHIDQVVEQLRDTRPFSAAHVIVVTDQHDHHDVVHSLETGVLMSVMTQPVKSHVVARQLAARVRAWATETYPDAPWLTEFRNDWGGPSVKRDETVRQFEMSSRSLVDLLLRSIEEELGPRPRLHIPAGVNITRQGKPVSAVYLVLSGSVALNQTDDAGTTVLLHHASSGPLIGLVSFTTRSLAAFTSQTTTDVVAVRVTIEQLERVMEAQSSTSALLAMVAMRALSDRLVRAEQLHIEKEVLADQLESEHESYTKAAREQLADARAELMDAARFAMLGELAAGIAHELNNPVAAIIRAGDHVGEDTVKLLSSLPHLDGAVDALTAARNEAWMSPKEERHAVRELIKKLGTQRDRARKLVSMGITDPHVARKVLKHPHTFDAMHYAADIGTSVRDIEVASRRITGLVQSLRSYSRADATPVDHVNVHEGLEDTLRLAAPRLSGVNVVRHYDPTLPTIRCFPSRLEQVWTNILINAAEAMEGVTTHPTIDITTMRHGTDSIRIKIEDNGPGIPDDIIGSIFMPHFTTKQGTVSYGLGMGLGISRQIVESHAGRIIASSSDHGAAFVVTLPIEGPGDDVLTEYGVHTAHTVPTPTDPQQGD